MAATQAGMALASRKGVGWWRPLPASIFATSWLAIIISFDIAVAMYMAKLFRRLPTLIGFEYAKFEI